MYTWWNEGLCGTVGCAMGHACNVPALKKRGLYLHKNSLPRLRGHYYPRTIFHPRVDPLETAQYLFGISPKDAANLFLPESYHTFRVTPKQVARRIGRLVQKLSKSKRNTRNK